jgi:hypothetical protein
MEREKSMDDAKLRKAIEAQRGKLGEAISVLQCLEVALEHGTDFHSGPHYVEVAHMVAEMLGECHNALDLDLIRWRAPARVKRAESAKA